MTNRNIGARYTLQYELGSGGMGTVYLGLDNITQQQVAIKALKPELAQNDAIERFKREGEALRDLNHPNIVKMLDMFEHDEQHYLVMEYITGGDLSDLIRTHGKIEVQRCVDMAIDLADALTRAHRLNIIHRDLKPANILIDSDDILRLTDFGVARMGSKERVTDTDAIIGTIDYLPPEAFNGQLFDARGDIWAFGVMLFEMLTGQRPFTGQTLMETIHAITTQPIPDLETLCPDAPITLVDLIYRMLERDPQARIPSVRVVGSELEAILEGRDYTPQPHRFDTDIPDFSTRPKHNLTAQSTLFVGREHELDELDKLLKDPTLRLITILAPGGMGKTRLSLELAQRAVDAGLYADGVYFVELAPVSDSTNIPNAIGDACGFQFLGEGTPKEQLISILHERQLLLVIDNYEHLSDGFGLVGDLLKNAPNLHIIATSRQRLSQSGETLFHLSGMDSPTWETPEDALEYAAVKLFMNSAKRAQPSFGLTDDNLDAVAGICKLVQGMPLGIVLAASWLSLLSVSEIADEIQAGLDFLETDETELPERQRSIRAVIDYSWAQMTDAEKQIFMKLSVFKGGFSRESAQAVAGANLRSLMSLMNKSLIRRDADGGRYAIHELLRQYAEEQLQQTGELEAVNLTHMTYFADFVAQRTPDIKGRRQIEGLNEIESDFDNIRDAWGYVASHANYDALDQMMEALALYVDMRAMFKLGEDLFADAVNQLSPLNMDEVHPVFNRLRIFYVRVWMLQEITPVPTRVLHLTDACLDQAHKENDLRTVLQCKIFKGLFVIYSGRKKDALGLFDSAIHLAYRLDEIYYVGNILRFVDNIYTWTRFLASQKSQEMGQKHLDITRQISDHAGLAHALFYHYWKLLQQGRLDESEKYLNEAVENWQLVGDSKSIGIAKLGLAEMIFEKGEFDYTERIVLEGLQLVISANFTMMNDRFYALLSLIQSIQGNYAEGFNYFTKTTDLNPYTMYDVHMSEAVLSIGKSDFELAKIQMKRCLVASERRTLRETSRSLSIVAFLLDYDNKKVWAVELIGLAYSYVASETTWMHKWDLLKQLRADLKSQLGEEAYNDAWERGKSLDLETVIQDLIDEFSDADLS